MKLINALEIIHDLAVANALEERDCDSKELKKERKIQQKAFAVVCKTIKKIKTKNETK